MYSPVRYMSWAPCTGTKGRAVSGVVPWRGRQKVNQAAFSGLMSGLEAVSWAWKHSQVCPLALRMSPTV